ncbi:MAG: ATP-binding protein [Actinomycetes bacterium]
MKLSLAARVALLVSALTMAAVSVAVGAIVWTTQRALETRLEVRQAEVNSVIAKDMGQAGSGATSWSDTSAEAKSLMRAYGARIAVTDALGTVLLDTGSGPLPPLAGPLQADAPEGGGSAGSTLAGPALLFVGPLVEAPFPWVLFALIGAVVVLVSGAIAVPLSRGLTRPLSRVGEVVESIREGDLSARVKVTSPPEIAALALGVNSMAARLQAGERQRRQFSADIAHELRSPLANIRNHLDAFEDGIIDPTPDNLAAVDSETERLTALVDELATVASIDEGSLRLVTRRSNVAELAAAAIDARRPAASQRGVTLTQRGSCPPAMVDPDRFTQIIGNLLDNSVRHSPAGGEVGVRIATRDSMVEVAIVDCGPGIALADLDRVFDRLWRADPARGHEGNHGLGLAIARGLARAHGGDLRAANLPEGGCEFTVVLPVGAPPAPALMPGSASGAVRSRPSGE